MDHLGNIWLVRKCRRNSENKEKRKRFRLYQWHLPSITVEAMLLCICAIRAGLRLGQLRPRPKAPTIFYFYLLEKKGQARYKRPKFYKKWEGYSIIYKLYKTQYKSSGKSKEVLESMSYLKKKIILIMYCIVEFNTRLGFLIK